MDYGERQKLGHAQGCNQLAKQGEPTKQGEAAVTADQQGHAVYFEAVAGDLPFLQSLRPGAQNNNPSEDALLNGVARFLEETCLALDARQKDV
jgi:hypothetical protein